MPSRARKKPQPDQQRNNHDAPRSRHPIADHFIEGPEYGISRPKGMDDWLIILTTRGNGEIHHQNGQLTAKPNSLVLLKPNHPHAYNTGPAGHWDLWWVHFILPPTWLPLLNWPSPAPGVFHLSLTDPETKTAVATTIQRTKSYAQRYLPHRAELAMNALHETLLWAHQQSTATNNKQNHDTQNPFDDRIRIALTWIDNNLTDPITVTDAARAASLSLSRFAHLFREQVGQSPQKFIEQRRLNRARDLLERTNLPIAEVGRRVGFDEAFYFSRRFKKTIGRSPSDHRKRAHRP